MMAEQREPPRIRHDAVELIAMENQKVTTVGGSVLRFRHKFDTGEYQSEIIAKRFVVSAGDIDHPCSVHDLGKDCIDHATMGRAPVRVLAQTPKVDNVADEIERPAVIVLQKIGQELGFAAGVSEMNIGNEDGSVPPDLVRGQGIRSLPHGSLASRFLRSQDAAALSRAPDMGVG